VKPIHPFLLIFFLAVLVRAVLNFSIPLVPGLGGGYNLVQIRSVIESGHLALPDMPLLYYLNAAIIKVFMFLFPNADGNQVIITGSKILDTILFPFLLYPLYLIQKYIIRGKYPILFLLAVAAFAVLSFAPLDLACDAQKNSLGLVLMTFFIYFFLRFLAEREIKDIAIFSLFLILTALTHFGVFCVALCFLITGLVVHFKWKALLPVAGAFPAGISLVWVFDPGRALSMVTFWQEAFSIFISPRLLYYPFGIFNFIFSMLLVWSMIRVLRRNKDRMPARERRIVLLVMVCIIILAFPFYGFEYGRRLGLMLFVPQSLALLLLYPYLSKRTATIISYAVLLSVLFIVSVRLFHPKPMAITEESYANLQSLKSRIDDPQQTLIFARHGLEWWVAWELRVRIASAYIEVDAPLKQKYDQIFFLVQKKGENLIYPGRTSIFISPVAPENSVLVYDSEYYEMYALEYD
jgi:hypothetical protein